MLMPRRKMGFKPLLAALLVALAIHLPLVLTELLPIMYRFWTNLFPQPAGSEQTEVTLVSMNQRAWEDNRTVRAKVKVEEDKKRPQPEQQEEKDKEQEEEPRGQVVDLAPTPDDSKPEDARFLSEHNTNVERESVSRDQRKDYGVAQPRATVADFKRKRPDQPPEKESRDKVTMLIRKQGKRETTPERQEQKFTMEIPDIQKRQSLKLKLDLSMGTMPTYPASESVQGNSDQLRLQMGEQAAVGELAGDEGEDRQTVAMFEQPSLDRLDMVTGAPANDHIRDVPKGEETLLNSREFRYATFFNRVKRGVSNHWNPGDVYMRRDPYGNIYGVKDRYTVLSVVLDNQGSLKDVSVAQSSGVGFLDDEAIHAFQGASPFPNPPRGLLEDDGHIRFQFGFYFEIGERPKFRAYRSRRF